MSDQVVRVGERVTIRGLDRELYARALALAKEAGRSVGEVINDALRLLLSTGMAATAIATKVAEAGRGIVEEFVEGAKGVLTVSGVEELSVSRRDLEAVEGQVSFRGIKRLSFSDDVDYELFERKVASVVMCGEVEVPKGFPKLKAASKMRLVSKLIERG
ncbi:MAG: hypothetical protein QXT74_02285 [Candidatus Nezhaarchaeales archaeon]